jgi:2-(1,2-epoxy-1,2-dihydrophenyl)acetyl-CoA isomerase
LRIANCQVVFNQLKLQIINPNTSYMEQSVLLHINDNIAFITLNRPEKFNAFNREMALKLQNILDECAANNTLRCIYITANGKAFCAGQDLAELTGDNAIAISTILSEHYNPIITRLRNIPLPIVCAVNGVAAGAGANIALACDIVIASDTASFIQAFSKIGLVPDSGGTFTLPRLIGMQRASALMMLGDKIMANDALQMGMLYKVFSADTLAAEGLSIALTLAKMPTKGLAYTKFVLNQSMNNSLEQQLLLEDEFQAKAAATEDYSEGVNAFLEKRQANFTGK